MLKNNTDDQNDNTVADNASTGNAAVTNSEADIKRSIRDYIMQSLLPIDCGVDLQFDDDLLSIDFLDSMQFMRLAQHIEQRYNLTIPAEDLLIENFQTVELLTQYLCRRLSSK